MSPGFKIRPEENILIEHKINMNSWNNRWIWKPIQVVKKTMNKPG